MRIRLEYKGRVIQEAESGGIAGEVLIGRGHQCEWRVPEEDRLVSAVHAVLYRQGRHLWIRDPDPPSKNGLYMQGRRLKKPTRITDKDKITLGDCVLVAERATGSSGGKPVPEIVVLSGRARGQRKAIVASKTTIGSSPGSTLVLMDDLVSRAHAEIVLKEDGSCWIKDLKSQNGTSVNGMALREGQERMLKDSDRIGVAHLELRFRDGTTQHSGRRVLLGFGVLVATVTMAMTGIWIWHRLQDPYERFLTEARQAADKGDFTAAMACITKAEGARGGDEGVAVIADLRRQVELWQSTDSAWDSVVNHLREARWREAARGLGVLDARPVGAWGWGAKGDECRRAYGQAKSLLDSFLRVKGIREAQEWNGNSIEELCQRLREAVDVASIAAPEYLGPLLTEARASLQQMEATVQSARRLDVALCGLTNWPPDLKQAVAVLDETARSDVRQLQERAQGLMDAVKGLDAGLEQLQKEARLAKDARFDEVDRLELALPPREVLVLDSRLAVAWNNLRFSHENLKKQAGEARVLLRRMEKTEKEVRAHGALDDQWRLDGNLGKVLDCDSLSTRFSVRREDRPLGEYDRYVGIEHFHDVLQGMNNREMPAPGLDDSRPTPLVVMSADLFSAAARLQAYLETGDGQWLNGGKLRETLLHVRELSTARERIVGVLMDEARKATGRRAVIAAGIAYQLCRDPSGLKIDGVGMEAWLAGKVKKLTDDVRKLSATYDSCQAQEQIALRDRILGIGLPGDRDVKRMWCQKSLATGE